MVQKEHFCLFVLKKNCGTIGLDYLIKIPSYLVTTTLEASDINKGGLLDIFS